MAAAVSGWRTRSAAAAIAVAAALAPAVPWAQGGPAAVDVAAVKRIVLADRTPLLGRVVAQVESAVASRVAGVVSTVNVSVGQSIEKDAVLARLDRGRLEIAETAATAALEEAGAAVSVAEAQLKLAEQVSDRAARLRGSTAFSRSALEDSAQEVSEAASALARAEAARAAARAALARVEYDLEHVTVKAPFAGVVVSREAQPGQYINQGATVATVVDLQSLEIEIDAPAELIGGLNVGDAAPFRVGPAGPKETTGEAVVRAIVPREDQETRTRPVRLSADIGAFAELSAPGASVTVYAPVGARREIIAAPKDALVQSGGGWMVFVAALPPPPDPNAEASKGEAPPPPPGRLFATATPKPVTIGAAAGDRIEIVAGLEEGDLVVIRGNERLRPGQQLAFTPPPGWEAAQTVVGSERQASAEPRTAAQ